jgi:hypothetical protein
MRWQQLEEGRGWTSGDQRKNLPDPEENCQINIRKAKDLLDQ